MCCFFKNEDTKIQVWIIIDCFLNTCYGFLLFIILNPLIGSPGGIVGPIWSFIVIIADIVLLFALKKGNTKFMLFWIFIMGFNINLILITATFLFSFGITIITGLFIKLTTTTIAILVLTIEGGILSIFVVWFASLLFFIFGALSFCLHKKVISLRHGLKNSRNQKAAQYLRENFI